MVEICIADRGIGVFESLCESKHTNPNNDDEALAYSLMPGISSKAWRYKKKKAVQKTVWDNSGYGLFLAHQLFGKLGHFFIASGNSALYLDADRYQKMDCSIEGTIVSMRMKLSDEKSIIDALKTTQNLAVEVKETLGVKSLKIASVEAFIKSGR